MPRPSKTSPAPHVQDPVDVVEGIPDRSPRPAPWKLLVLAAIFLAWLAFMVISGVVGGR